MASKYWIKLYHEVLDDPKMGQLSDRLWRRSLELFLIAGEYQKDGILPKVSDMAWRLRMGVDELITDLGDLASGGIVHNDKDTWIVTHFAERQAAESGTERWRRWNERQRKNKHYSDDNPTQTQRQSNDDPTLSLQNKNKKKNKNKTIEEEFENLETKPEREPLDKDAYLERIATATASGITNETSQIMALKGIDLSHYPEDVLPVLTTLVNCWNIKPPRHSKKSNGQYAQWVSDGRDLLDACGEFGVEAIVSFRSEYDKYMDDHNGLAPFSVNGPGSLVKSVRGHTAIMRQPVKKENPYKGANMVMKGGQRIL